MKTFGDLKLPVEKTVKVNIKSYEDEINFLLDIRFENQFPFLKEIFISEKPSVNFIRTNFFVKDGLFIYSYLHLVLVLAHPPAIWKEFKDQKFIIYVAPDFYDLEAYFLNKKMRCYDNNELNIILSILEMIKPFKQRIVYHF